MGNLINRTKKIKNFEYILLSILLLLGLIARLYKITNPIADWHSWRQADTASVSRIYVEDGINLLYPRYYDISSIQTGIYNPEGYRFVEFPLFNILHAFLYKALPSLGFEVWGRTVSIFLSLASAFFLYFLGNRFIGKPGGILASFFFLFIPYNVYFSRVILPEPLAVALGLASIWFLVKFLDEVKYRFLYLGSLLFTLSLLVKPFTVFYAVPVIYLFSKKYSFRAILTNIKLVLALDLALVPFFLWRTWMNQYPAGIPHFTWAFNGDQIRFRPAFWRWIFGERLGYLILGIWGLIPFSFGVLKSKAFNLLFIFGMFLYVVTLATANVRHDYYQTLIIPAISLILAQGTIYLWSNNQFNKMLTRGLLVFSTIMMLGIGAYQVKEFYKVNHPEIIEAGNALDKIAPKDAKVIAPYNGDTAFLYQTKRFGWPVVEDSIEETIEKGARYFVTVNFADPDTAYVEKNYTVLVKTDKYLIADLTKPKKK